MEELTSKWLKETLQRTSPEEDLEADDINDMETELDVGYSIADVI